jgi:hypothetical protein
MARLFFIHPLEVVVEHSRMTNQTHLLWQLDIRLSNQGATPGTDNLEGWRLDTLKRFLRIDLFTQLCLPD